MNTSPLPDVSSLLQSSLLLLGHGSTLNADSSAPTCRQAAEIRRRGIFHDVQVAFWKEEPNFRQALRQTGTRNVYVVPNFISSGYFTEQVIPRELGLNGAVSLVEGRGVAYCEPTGLHPAMTEALLREAFGVVERSGAKPADPARTACLFICGHGTSLNDNSTRIIHERATEIRARGLFADCQGVLMEQAPFVKDWRTLTDCRDVVVVPFFISDGLHSYEDIPVLLGLTHNVHEAAFTNPHIEADRRLWYANAIGTASFMTEVILAQVEAFRAPDAGYALTQIESNPSAISNAKPLPWNVGQVRIEAGYRLFHREDKGRTDLKVLESEEDLRELVRLDEEGRFRPLRAAPNLRRGWIFHAADDRALHEALGHLYPAALVNAELWSEGRLPVTPWRETAERQTGRFRIVRELDEAGVAEMVTDICERGCLKQRLWSPASVKIETATGEPPLLCPEACNYFVGKAREKLKGPGEE